MKHLLSISLTLLLASFHLGSYAQALNDPAIDGMRVLPRVEGCNVPGGLQPITSSDGPNDAMFWCGPPPYCLTMPVGSPERCHIIPGSRNGGATAVRNPLDLRCDVSGVNPTGPTHSLPGRCPVAPALTASVNGVQDASVAQGGAVILNVNTEDPRPLSEPTSLTMHCTGANAGVSPFSQTNLIARAGQNYTFPAASASSVGMTSCTITATNAVGSQQTTVTFNSTSSAATPPPTVQAVFNPTNPTVNSRVQVRTRTTNATSLTWSCSGRWGNRNTPRALGGWVVSNHNVSGSPGSATCTFTAVGPGGTTSTTARWTSVAGGGSGGGDTSMPTLPDFQRNHTLAEVCAEGHITRAVRYLPARSHYTGGVMRIYVGTQLVRTVAVVNGQARWHGPTTKDRYIATVSSGGINVQQYSHNLGYCTGT